MMKRLAIPAGAVLIVAAILVAVYHQQRHAVGEGYDIKCVQPSEPSSAANSLSCEIHPSQNADQGKSKPQWWNVLIAWPSGITAWLLMLTLGAIVWQAWETRRAADAGAEASKAARASIRIQEAQYKQWVEIGGWKNWSRVRPEDIEAKLSLGFAVQNNTNFPLTLLQIKTSRAAQSSSGSFPKGILIAPKNAYDAFFAFDISPAELQLYRLDNLAVTLTTEIVIKDVLGNESEPQKFTRTITFGPNRCEVVSHPRHIQLAVKFTEPKPTDPN